MLNKCLTTKQNKIPVTELSADVNTAVDLKIALGI